MELKRALQRAERGAALISALLIVSVISVVTLSLLETIRHSARLSNNIADREQARFYALAAEELVISNIKQLWTAESERNVGLDLWIQTPILFPIPDGSIDGELSDGANCYNINTIVKASEEGGYDYDEQAAGRFAKLLEEIGVPPSDALSIANEAADWIDTNRQTSFSGAEDDYYTGLDTPYRTAGQLLTDVSEIKSLRSMTPTLYETLEEFMCVRPTTDLEPLNLNTLESWQAPLLAVYLGGDYTLEQALQLLQERPVGGYDTLSTFAEQLRIFENQEEARTDLSNKFALASEIYSVSATIRYRDTSLSVVSTLQITDGGDIRRLSRKYGTF